MTTALRVLVTDPNQVASQLIKQTVTARRAAEVIQVASAEEARAAIAGDAGIFDLAFLDADLPDEPGLRLARWIRTDEKSPRPNLPIILMSGSFTPESTKAAMHAGARFLLPKPFNSGRLTLMIQEATTAYPNFIVSPSYIGPDRRVSKRPVKADRRVAKSIAVQIVDEPSNYALGSETIVVIFDYLKLRLSGAGNDMFRDFILRPHLARAMHNIPVLQERLLTKVTQQHTILQADTDALAAGANGSTLKRMNRSAHTISVDTTTAGFTLMAAIATSLHHYTSGAYDVSDRLVRFLSTHVVALKSAIAHRIFDDGGAVGHTIVSTIGAAEAIFRRPASA